MKNKKRYSIARWMLFVSCTILFAVCSIRSTYAWIRVSSQRGIYPFYEVEFTTPATNYYARVEVATEEELIDDEWVLQYVDIADPSVNIQLLYPGDRINLRLSIINLGEQATSLSIYFKNIVDTQLTDPETGDLLDSFVSKSIVFGSSTFNGIGQTGGFAFYANEQLNFQQANLTPITIPNTNCANRSDHCYVHVDNILLAGNVEIASASLRPGKSMSTYNNRLAVLEATSQNLEADKEDLIYEFFQPVNLDWYMMLDRMATIETASALFQIGTILFSVD